MSGQPSSHIPSSGGKTDETAVLRTVTEKEINWLRETISEVKNRGDGYGEIVITIRRGRIQKVKAAGEEIPDIYE